MSLELQLAQEAPTETPQPARQEARTSSAATGPQLAHERERAAAYAANPTCVSCTKPIADPLLAVYFPHTARLSHLGPCSVEQFAALWERITQPGALGLGRRA